MPIGDGTAAAAAGMAVVDGSTAAANTIDTLINAAMDYTALGYGAVSAATASKVIKRDANGRAKIATPAAADDIATKGYVDGRAADKITNGAHETRVTSGGVLEHRPSGSMKFSVNASGDINTARDIGGGRDIHADRHLGADGDVSAEGDGQFAGAWNNNITSTRRSVWMTSAGKLGHTASSSRYKKNIAPWAGLTDEQFAALSVVTFQWRDNIDKDDHEEVGMIAEALADAGLEWAIFRDEQGRPEGIHYDRVVLAVIPYVQSLAARVTALES